MASRLAVAAMLLCLPGGAARALAAAPASRAFVQIQGSGTGYDRDGNPDPTLADFDLTASDGGRVRLEKTLSSSEGGIDTMVSEARAGVDSTPDAPVRLHTYARSSGAVGPGSARGLARWADVLTVRKDGVTDPARLPRTLDLHWAVSGKMSFLLPGQGTALFYADFEANGAPYPRCFIDYHPGPASPGPSDFKWRWAGPPPGLDPDTGAVKAELVEKVLLDWKPVKGAARSYVATVSYQLTFVSLTTSRGGWTVSDFDHTMTLDAVTLGDGSGPGQGGMQAAFGSGAPPGGSQASSPGGGGGGGGGGGAAGGGSGGDSGGSSGGGGGPPGSFVGLSPQDQVLDTSGGPGPTGPGGSGGPGLSQQPPPGGPGGPGGGNPPTTPVSSTPEPGGLALLGGAFLALALARRGRVASGPSRW